MWVSRKNILNISGTPLGIKREWYVWKFATIEWKYIKNDSAQKDAMTARKMI
jgi:hypothetical protein